jgi:lipopolysaccharide export system permease protein
MNTITRYVVADVLKVFLVALTCLTVLMLILGVTRQAIEQGVGAKQIVLLLPYIVPDALRFTIPATILFASSAVYGRMSGSNEVVALKSLGISPMVVLWPILIIGFCLSLVTVWLNDVAVSWGRNGVRRVVIEAVEEIAYSRLKARHEYNSKSFSVIVKGVEGRKLIEPTFTFQRAGADRPVTLRCRYAALSSDGQDLTLRCFDGTLDDGQVTYRFPGTEVHALPLENVSGAEDDSSDSPSWMSLSQIYEQLDQQPALIAGLQREQAMKAAANMLLGQFGDLTSPEWASDQNKLEAAYYILYRMRTEPPRRWANGFSCLCFVLVGSTVAIRLRNANMLSSFFICFLPILCVYYPLLAVGVDQAKNGHWPAATVWMGNAVMTLWGVWMLKRVLRY